MTTSASTCRTQAHATTPQVSIKVAFVIRVLTQTLGGLDTQTDSINMANSACCAMCVVGSVQMQKCVRFLNAQLAAVV